MKVINIHPITQTGINSGENYHDGRPCFSPDGNTVLFNQQNNIVYLQNGNSEPIPFSDTTPGVNGRAPWFSNDGLVMAFESKSETTNLRIFLKSVDLENPNTPIIPVSDPEYAAQHAKFSPDGSQLVWAQNDNQGKSQIYIGTVIY